MRVECYDPRNKRTKCFSWSGQGCTLLAEGFEMEMCPFYKSKLQYKIDKARAVDRLMEHNFLREAVAMYGKAMVVGRDERTN